MKRDARVGYATSVSTTLAFAVLMAKYGRAAGKRVKSAMHRKKKGTLRSGSGRKVKSRKQAIAIGLNEARKKGAKVPRTEVIALTKEVIASKSSRDVAKSDGFNASAAGTVRGTVRTRKRAAVDASKANGGWRVPPATRPIASLAAAPLLSTCRGVLRVRWPCPSLLRLREPSLRRASSRQLRPRFL